MLRTTSGTRGGLLPRRVEAPLSGLVLRSVGGMVSRKIPCRVSDAPGGSVRRVSGTLGGLVLRCVGGMLCAVLVASGCSDDGSNAAESVTTTIPPTTAAPITTAPATTTVPMTNLRPATTVRASTAQPTTEAATPSTASPTTEAATPSTASPTTGAATPSTASPTTAAAQLSEDDHVFAAIVRYFEVIVEANDPPNPDSPLFDGIASPWHAVDLRRDAREHLTLGRGIRLPADRQPFVRAPNTVVRRDSIAVVDICLRDNLETYDLNTDAVIDDSVVYSWVQLTVTDYFGGLLVSHFNTVQKFDSEEPCIAAYR